VWRVAGLKSQLTTYHTTQLECPTVTQSIYSFCIIKWHIGT
jgi:hypothetical protein